MSKKLQTQFDNEGNLTIHAPHLRGLRMQLVETTDGFNVTPAVADTRRTPGLAAFVGRIWPAAEYVAGRNRIKS